MAKPKPDYKATSMRVGGHDVMVLQQVAGVTLPQDAQAFIREHPEGGFLVRFSDDDDDDLSGERVATYSKALATGALLSARIVGRQLNEAEREIQARLDQFELPLQSGVLE